MRQHARARQPLLNGSVLEDQIELEDTAMHQGVLRYYRKAKQAVDRNDGASLKPAERFILHWIDPLTNEIKQEKRKILSGDGSFYRSVFGPLLLQVQSDRAALCVLREMVSGCMKQTGGVKATSLYHAIGRAVIGEINYEIVARYGRGYITELDKRYSTISPAKMNWWARKLKRDGEDVDSIQHDAITQVKLGAHLCWLACNVCSATDYENFTLAFHNETRHSRGKSLRMVRMDEAVLDDIERGHDLRKFLRPRYLPMVVEPCAWAKEQEGGYVKIRTPFVAKPEKIQKQALDNANLDLVYDCLSAVNATAWRINKTMHGIMARLWDQGGNIGKIPERNDRALPPKPRDIDTNDDAKKQWKRSAHLVHAHNHRIRGKRLAFVMAMDVARDMLDRDAIYFPHQFDFRSRAYPIPSHLNHQGDDSNRALLEFAEYVEPDMRWVKIHLANCCGVDKVSYADRVSWVDSQIDTFARWVDNPFTNDEWQNQDEPLQALAAAHALFDREAAGHLPIQVDGSCNGLQHYSAMMRDPLGAAAVNVLPNDSPADVYNQVAQAAEKVSEADVAAGDAIAAILEGQITRKIAKQPVMTAVYGVTRHGATDQVYQAIDSLGIEDNTTRRRAAVYLSGVILEGIGEVCEGAGLAMAWLRACSRIIAKDKQPVSWVTPLGFPVVQGYYAWEKVNVRSKAQEILLIDRSKPAPIKKGKQATGGAPNFVHSLDASHMLMTARRAQQNHIAFAGVHDSYWTHAGDMDKLQVYIRDEFAALHKRPALDVLAEQFNHTYDNLQFPDPPEVGNLDLDRVRQSDYFFS